MENFRNLRNLNVGGRDIRTAYDYTPNINEQFLTPRINHLNIPSNVCDYGGDALNPYCGDPCPLPDNNPQNFSIVDNSPRAVNGNYQSRVSSTMRNNYHISPSPQQQQQKQVYELLGFPGYKVELVFTPITNNHQFAQSMNTPQIDLDKQILSSQSEISQRSLNSCGSTNNPMQSYIPNNNYGQQSSVTTSLQNYQSYYNSSQQQQQTKTFGTSAFVGYEIPDNNQQNNVNNFYRPM